MKQFTLKPVVRAVAETLNRALFGYMKRTGLLFCATDEVQSFTETLYYISDTLPATYDALGYAAILPADWKLIDKVQDFPTFGGKRAMNKFTPIAGPVEKTAGAADYGDGDLVCGDVPANVGQLALASAFDTPNQHRSFKCAFPDGGVTYLDGVVSSWMLSAAKEGAFRLRTATLGFNRKPVEVPAP